jgi:hypothetical protein
VRVRVGLGHAVVVRWDRYGRRAKLGRQRVPLASIIRSWLKLRDVALIVWETAGYTPQPSGDLFRNAVH